MPFQTMSETGATATASRGRVSSTIPEACLRERKSALLAFASWSGLYMWPHATRKKKAFEEMVKAIARQDDRPLYTDIGSCMRTSRYPMQFGGASLWRHPAGIQSVHMLRRQLAMFDELLVARMPVPLAVQFVARQIYGMYYTKSAMYNTWRPAAWADEERRELRERVWRLSHQTIRATTYPFDVLRLRGPAVDLSDAHRRAGSGAYTLTIESHVPPVGADAEAVRAWFAGSRRREHEQERLVECIFKIGVCVRALAPARVRALARVRATHTRVCHRPAGGDDPHGRGGAGWVHDAVLGRI